MSLSVVHNTVEDLVRTIRAKFMAADAAEGKLQSARVMLGKMLLELRGRIEAGEEGDVEWWAWYATKFDRTRRDAERLLAIANKSDPEAAYEEEKAKRRERRAATTPRCRDTTNEHNRDPVERIAPPSAPEQTADDRKALYAAAEMVPTEHSPPSAPSMDDEEWTEKDEKIGQQNLATVFRMNCAAALQVVKQGYAGPINKRVLAAVRQTADAWTKLADELEAAAELAPEAAV